MSNRTPSHTALLAQIASGSVAIPPSVLAAFGLVNDLPEHDRAEYPATLEPVPADETQQQRPSFLITDYTQGTGREEEENEDALCAPSGFFFGLSNNFYFGEFVIGKVKWPCKSVLPCEQCCETFTKTRVMLPHEWDAQSGILRDCSGNWCSIGCLRRFVMESNIANKAHAMLAISAMCLFVFGVSDSTVLGIAPPRKALVRFGGTMSIEQYRAASSLLCITAIDSAPFLPTPVVLQIAVYNDARKAAAMELLASLGMNAERAIEVYNRMAQHANAPSLDPSVWWDEETGQLVDLHNLLPIELTPPNALLPGYEEPAGAAMVVDAR